MFQSKTPTILGCVVLVIESGLQKGKVIMIIMNIKKALKDKKSKKDIIVELLYVITTLIVILWPSPERWNNNGLWLIGFLLVSVICFSLFTYCMNNMTIKEDKENIDDMKKNNCSIEKYESYKDTDVRTFNNLE